MSSIVLSVLSFATGSLYNNVCDRIANRLNDGDCTDEKCRQLIARELDEIKTRLDGLTRKDLLSSVCFLKDGLCMLNCTFQGEASVNVRESCKAESIFESDELITIINKTLNRSLRVCVSKEVFNSAKLSFQNAYLKATEAFNNEALKTTERILATKLRVVSKTLQCLEDPEAAIAFCKLYLQQLHELTSVRKRYGCF